MPEFDSNGTRIHFEDRGVGDPIVLVHGFASNARNNWGVTGWLDLLARHHRVIALDCRGHGLSAKQHDRAEYEGTAMEDDVIRLMDHAGVDRALLQGYSMGGRISMGLLARHPERFRAVVLGGVGMTGDATDSKRRAAITSALLTDDPSLIKGETPRLFRQFAELNKNDLKALGACMSADRSPIDPSALSNNQVPTLIIIGSKDNLVGGAPPLKNAIKNSRLIEIEGRDHLSAPGDNRYKEAVMEFLRSAPA